MSHPLLNAIEDARAAIFTHLEITGDGIYGMIEDSYDKYWYINSEREIIYWDDNNVADSAELYPIYKNKQKEYLVTGKDLSLVLADWSMGGDKVPMVLDNSKRQLDLPAEIAQQI